MSALPAGPRLVPARLTTGPESPGVVVVHAGARDGYQVPFAFAEVGRLERFVTDLRFGPLAGSAVARLGRYRHPGIPASLTEACRLTGLVLRVRKRLQPWLVHDLDLDFDRRLGRSAARAAHRRGAPLLAYSYYAPGAIEEADRLGHAGARVVFQLHPCRGHVATLLAQDRRETGLPFRPDREELAASAAVDESRWVNRTDGVICTSSFTAAGLREFAGCRAPITIVPYGTDAAGHAGETGAAAADRGPVDDPAARDRPLRLLTVAQMTQRKGLHHLFDALARLGPGRVEHRLVARGWRDPVLTRMVPHATTLLGAVSGDELARLYRWADAFVLPSLAEGFGLVFVEAMAAGLPVIGTGRTCLPDVLPGDASAGFVVPAGDYAALHALIERLADEPRRLAPMRTAARAVASGLTWERFRAGVRAAVP